MKKIMFAAAVAAAMTGLADVSSQNIVGYMNKDSRKNASVQIATFNNVGAEGMDVQKIIPVVKDGEVESGNFTMQFYDQWGIIESGGQFIWMIADDSPDGKTPGWYLEDYETLAVRVLNPGEGFNMSCEKPNSFLQYSGEVDGTEIEIPARKNASSQGNLRPVQVSVQDIIPVVKDGEVESGNFTMQFYDQWGIILPGEQYIWMIADDSPDGETPGWYLEDYETLCDRILEPGEGFNMSCEKENSKLFFPALSL